MAIRLIAIPVHRRQRRADRLVLAAAAALAIFTVVLTWQTFAARTPASTAISRLEAAQPFPGLPAAPDR